jgi:hypothetical protein|nr:MAG TPA: hypothetical protein [Caudoviricetes sp.]
MKELYDTKTNQFKGVVSNDITIVADELREAQSEILTVLKKHKFNYEVSVYVLDCLIPKLKESLKYEQITVL